MLYEVITVLAEEPVDQPVVELEVGRQVGAAQHGAAQDLGEVLVTVEAISYNFV